LTKMQ